jgi:hypothetical protein
MLEKFAKYFSLLLLSITLITHILKLVYMLFKPIFMDRYKYFSNINPTKTDLILYYILTMGCSFYIIWKQFN